MNRRSPLAFLVLTAISLASFATAQQATARISARVDDSALVTLHGTVHPLANAANDRGAVADDQQLTRMHLLLSRSAEQQTALEQLLREQHTPGAANYHKWLTPEEFGQKFGPAESDVVTLTSWLANHGFTVKGLTPGGQTIEFSGTAAQMRSAFHTQIHQYKVSGNTHYANAAEPQIPQAFGEVVKGFATLNNFQPRRMSHVRGRATVETATGKVTPNWTVGSSAAGYSLVLSPADFAVQYDLNPLYNASISGSGQTIAIINDANINVALVNQFRTLFGLSANPPQVIIDGNDPGIDGENNPGGANYDSTEAYLDVEWAGAVAPQATIDLVIAGNTELESGLYLAAERAVESNIAPVISVSFGECEAYLGSTNAFLSALWQQAAAQGITVLVSSGDSGSAGCDNDSSQYYAVGGQAVNGFASTPYNVAVGGTDFYYTNYNGASSALSSELATYWDFTASNTTPKASLKSVIPEQPWNESQYGLNFNSIYTESGGAETLIVGGGGGASNAANCSTGSYSSSTGLCTGSTTGYSKPSWQTGTGVPSDGVRDLPDLSLFASSGINASYYPLCAVDGDCQSVSSGTVQFSGVGGTSASAPAFAGIMALVNQKYGRQGQAARVLYPLKKQFPASFHDVTHGNNSVPCKLGTSNCIASSSSYYIDDPTYGYATEGQIGSGSTPYYSASAGYNLATGLGTVDAYQMVTNWGSVSFASTATSLAASQSSFTHGSSVKLSGTVTATSGTPTGQVALLTDNSDTSSQSLGRFTLSSGSYSGSLSTLPGGSYNIWAQYGGDSNYGLSTSSKTQLTVTPEASGIFFSVLTPSTSGAGILTSGTTNIPYGTQLMLSAMPVPSAQLTAFTACETGTSTSCPSFELPSGNVVFKDGTTSLATAVINAEGDAEYNAPFAVGTHSVTASYSGDNSYKSSSSSAVAFTVVKGTPSMAISAANETSKGYVVTGQQTVFNIQVLNATQASSTSNGVAALVPVTAPTGTVTVTSTPTGISGSASLSAATDANYTAVEGVGSITAPATLAAGSYTVKAAYSGDTNYNAVTKSYTVMVVSSGGVATTTTATTAGSISSATSLKISGTVTGKSGYGVPSGVIIVYASGNVLGEVSLSQASSYTSSYAITLNSASLEQGSNLLTLQYSGDSTYNPSAATVAAVNNTLSDFTLLPQAATVPVTQGATASGTLLLASLRGFSGAVSLSCTAATGVTCSVPATATLTSAGTAVATLSLTAASSAAKGNYNISIVGKNSTGTIVHTASVTAQVAASSAAVTLSATSLSFASTAVGSNATAQSVTLKNTGTSALTVSGVSISGTNASSFTVSSACGSSLAAGASCALTVGFKPTATGSLSATLSIADNATNSPQTVTLGGTGTAPVVALSSTALSFVATSVGSSATAQKVTVTNNGSSALTVSSATFSGTNASSFNVTNGCTAAVAVGSSCVLTVGFKPLASGALTATLSIADNATNSPQTVALSGTGAAPAVTLSATTLSFASTAVGSSATAQSLTLQNSGTSSLTIGSVTIAGANASSFSVTSGCGSTVAAGASCTLTVGFKPTLAGALKGTLTLSDNAANAPQTVALSGTGAAPTVKLSATTLSFAATAVSSSATSQSITVLNTGSVALLVSSASITGTGATSFSLTNGCTSSVAAGSSCTLTVGFSPKSAGALSAALSIASNASGSPQTIALSGTGAAPVVTLSATALSFASTSVGSKTVTKSVTVTNTGTAALTLSGAVLGGSNASSFTLTNGCGTTLAVGGSCTLTAGFVPQAAGALSARITLTDSAANSPQTIALTGTGTAPAVTLSASSLSFAATAVGTAAASKSVTIKNSGSATLTLSGIALGGTNASAFTLTNGCGTTLAAGLSCTLTVGFKPTASGSHAATITLTDDAPSASQSIALTGTAAVPVAALSSSSLLFPATVVGASTAYQKITLANNSTVTLSITGVTLGGSNASSFLLSNGCGSTLAPGASCSLAVSFQPKSAGSFSGTISVSNNGVTPLQTIALSGSGTSSSSKR